jgi:hypothetical protein
MTSLSTSEIAMKRRVSLMLEINVDENRRDNQRMDNPDTQYNTEN